MRRASRALVAAGIACAISAASGCSRPPATTPPSPPSVRATDVAATSRDALAGTLARARARLATKPGDADAAILFADAALREVRVSGNGALAADAERALIGVLRVQPD